MSNTPRALRGFLILAPHPKSLRQIGGNWGSGNELRKCMRTSFVGGSFFVGNGVGIEALAKPIFVRGVAPSMEAACRTLQWLACFMPAPRARFAPFVVLRICKKEGCAQRKAHPFFSFCFMWKKLEIRMADDGVSRSDYGVFTVAPYGVVYEDFECHIAFRDSLFPEPLVFADALHGNSRIPVETAPEPADEQLVPPTGVVFGDDPRQFPASRRLARALGFACAIRNLFSSGFFGNRSLLGGGLGCCFFCCLFCGRHLRSPFR